MPPVRKPKSAVSAWIVEQRNRQDPAWKSEELARRLGVAESTVRGWESGRTISDANLIALERLFGVEAPGGRADQPGGGDVAAAIDRQTDVMRELLDEFRASRLDRERLQSLADAVRVLVLREQAVGAGDPALDAYLRGEASSRLPSPTPDPRTTGGGSAEPHRARGA
jgi:transcriptional regulator with XRE-family HTH domain